MRVYKFLCAEFALQDIEEHRIKLSEFEDMNDPLLLLSDSDLRTLAIALREKRLVAPFSTLTMGQLVGPMAGPIALRFSAFLELGMAPEHIAEVLDAMAAGRFHRGSGARR